jgi:hypothetical protein
VIVWQIYENSRENILIPATCLPARVWRQVQLRIINYELLIKHNSQKLIAKSSRLRRDGDQLWFVFASSPNHAVPELVEGLPAHKANGQ